MGCINGFYKTDKDGQEWQVKMQKADGLVVDIKPVLAKSNEPRVPVDKSMDKCRTFFGRAFHDKGAQTGTQTGIESN